MGGRKQPFGQVNGYGFGLALVVADPTRRTAQTSCNSYFQCPLPGPVVAQASVEGSRNGVTYVSDARGGGTAALSWDSPNIFDGPVLYWYGPWTQVVISGVATLTIESWDSCGQFGCDSVLATFDATSGSPIDKSLSVHGELKAIATQSGSGRYIAQ